MPVYLQQAFGANYRMVTLIPVVFGGGKWLASMPTGWLLDRVGRSRLMAIGLVLIAVCDVASAMTEVFAVFLGLRAAAGVGWAMFGTVAATIMVDRGGDRRRGRAVSLLLMSESLGLLLGILLMGLVTAALGAGTVFFLRSRHPGEIGAIAGELRQTIHLDGNGQLQLTAEHFPVVDAVVGDLGIVEGEHYRVVPGEGLRRGVDRYGRGSFKADGGHVHASLLHLTDDPGGFRLTDHLDRDVANAALSHDVAGIRGQERRQHFPALCVIGDQRGRPRDGQRPHLQG